MNRFWIIWLTIIMHVLWGLTALISADALNATPLHALAEAFHATRFHVAVGLFTASWFATFGLVRKAHERRPEHIVWFLPQQAVLLTVLFATIRAMLLSHYADGTVVPQLHIFVDQLPVALAAIIYTVAIWEHFVWNPLLSPSRPSS